MTPDTPNAVSHSANARTGLIPGLLGNLLSGLRVATGLRVSRAAFQVSAGQAVALVLLLGLTESGVGWLTTEAPRQFDAYGLNYLGATMLFSLLLLLLVGRLAGGGLDGVGRLVIGYLSASVAITLVSALLWQAESWYELPPEWAWGLFWLLLGWHWMVVVLLLRQPLSSPRIRSLLLGAGYALSLFASLWIFPRSELWYSDVAEPASPAPALDVESIYYAQPALMDATLSSLEVQRPGIEDLYLLALGGYGYEDVFLNEVEYVRNLFDNTYGTDGRSLILANNPATVDRYPLASRPNLELALGSMSQRMDTDEDVLFLFLTSHGSRDHRFSLEMGPLQLHDLTPQQLRGALDSAGIRWRVVLVSSCYSGGFIEALQDPATLVITAAAADRTSFGCGVDSDFTYFGTAYFKTALPEEPRFIQAFELANTWVGAREASEDLDPSLPQIFVGDAIADKLASLYAEPTIQAALEGRAPVLTVCAKAAPPGSCE
ncbi:MAG: peptidase C13 [Oceanospirillaceae bacterium]|nr:peptidase C13 [Oceanospirillaceae bacterium]